MTDYRQCECDDCDCGNAVPANQPVCIQCRNGQHERNYRAERVKVRIIRDADGLTWEEVSE